MQKYYPPPDMDEKIKIVGGILTLQQGGWLALGFIIAMGFMLLTHKFLWLPISFIIGVGLGAAVGGPFAFKKVHDLTLYRYLVLKQKDKKKVKHLPNKRKED